MEYQADRTMSGADLPCDILHRVFDLAVATSHPSTKPKIVADIFVSAPPYNIMRVCRSWRDTALSGPTLWSTFAFSFSSPSVRTLEALKWLIELHILRSQSTLLSFSVELESYNGDIGGQIVDLLVGQERRWKKAHLHISTALPTHLNVEDLHLLEELHMRFSTSFVPTTTTISGPSPSCVLNSLTRLELGIPSTLLNSEAFRWLHVAPNVQELTIMHTYDYFPFNKQYPTPDVPFVLPNLRFLDAGGADAYRKRPLSASLLKYITCPTLVELHLLLYNAGSEDALFAFFSRSAPPLTVLSLNIEAGYVPWEEQRYTMLLKALALVPTITNFRVVWYRHLSVDILTREMTRKLDLGGSSLDSAPFEILPLLERLEINHVRSVDSDSASEYVKFLRERWYTHPRTLKAVKIGSAHHISHFLSQSPAVRIFVSEGLQFEMCAD